MQAFEAVQLGAQLRVVGLGKLAAARDLCIIRLARLAGIERLAIKTIYRTQPRHALPG